MDVILAQVLPEVSDDAVARACEVPSVDEAGLVCRNVFRWTENEAVARIAEWFATAPLQVLIIFVVAVVVNRLARRLINKLITEMTDAQARDRSARVRRLTPTALRSTKAHQPLRAAARAETIGTVLKSLSSIVVYSIATMMAMSEFGVELAPLIAGAGIAGVALGFGAQSLVKDFLSGLFMLAEDQYGVGDVVDVGEATGTVEVVNLRTTRLRGVDGTVWHVPNGQILRVGNMSQQWARALLDIAVAYDTDLDRAMHVVKEEADALWHADEWRTQVLEEPEVWGVQALQADGVTIRLVLKTQPGEQWSVTRELNRRLKARFDAEGIEIPFPQRVMWVRRDESSSRNEDVVDPTRP